MLTSEQTGAKLKLFEHADLCGQVGATLTLSEHADLCEQVGTTPH